MQESQPSLFMRHDTFLGICEGLGEDFGFNPLFLRITLSALLLWNPVAVLGGYLGAGVIVLLSRWIFPKPRQAAEPAVVQQEQDAPVLAMAA